jgi:hypothetical protein
MPVTDPFAVGAELGCAVFVNGERLADTAAEFSASVPAVLAGLSTVWGRETAVDQPSASTCTFTVQDAENDADFLGLLHVGHTVDVFTQSTRPNASPVDTAIDGSFETAPISSRAKVTDSAGRAAISTADKYDGNRSILYTGLGTVPGSGLGSVLIPPAPFDTKNPASAWDPLTPARPGETWTVRFRARVRGVRSPLNVSFQMAVWPDASPASGVYLLPVQTVAANNAGWTVLEQTVPIPADMPSEYKYPGLRVTIYSTAWNGAAGSWAAAIGTWTDWASSAYVDLLEVLAPVSAVERRQVFGGRITDLVASAAGGGVSVSVTAVDRTADLANDVVGDVPWLEERLDTRVARLATLTRAPFQYLIDSRLRALMVTWRDVDAQPAMSILSELAESGDGVLWSTFTAASGFRLWIEDTWSRETFAVFVQDPGTGIVTIDQTSSAAPGMTLSACEFARNEVEFEQDVTDILTSVDVSWQEQTTDPDSGQPAPTERHEFAEDGSGQWDWGIRRLSMSTQLSRQADAVAVANRLLARVSQVTWHASGFVWDFRITEFTETLRQTALSLLDGTTRIGLPLTVTELPDWVPDAPIMSVFVDGGTYQFTGGRWILALNISPSATSGAAAQWKQLPVTYRWADYDASIAWVACWGVGA